ncbi:hypothetical protein RvY_03931 [Ramazzottius varieornatus]|uniref:Uncharacterized protein n=1 Tax=Ramazzottius varieornatus TaxID=947166 RepID=A0A1D1UWU3_RAMVA|nr:hypothetical protein RvY_03931 [Ramazzottius varieornatus]
MYFVVCVALLAGCALAQGPDQGRQVGNWTNISSTSPTPSGPGGNGSQERTHPWGHSQGGKQGGEHGKPPGEPKEKDIEEKIAQAMMEQLLKGEPVRIKVFKASRVAHVRDGDSSSSEEDQMVPVTLDASGKPVVGADKPYRSIAKQMFKHPSKRMTGQNQ